MQFLVLTRQSRDCKVGSSGYVFVMFVCFYLCLLLNLLLFLVYLGPMLWSKLDKEIRNSNSLNSFKNTIRKKNLEALLEEGCHNCPLCSN